MKLDDFKPSDNVEDRRGQGGMGFPGGRGRGMNIPIGMGRGGFSFKTILFLIVVYLIFRFVFGVDLISILNGGGGSLGPTTGGYEDTTTPGTTTGDATTGNSNSGSLAGDDGSLFVKKVLASTESFWSDFFAKHGETYQKPRLVLFRGFVQSACGTAQSAMGPFYCPGDQKVYIDLSFYKDLKDKLGAPGDFAQGYVIAHEVGHHIQNLVGTAQKVQAQRSRVSEAQANELSVRMELQADCYAGMWGKYMQDTNHLDPGDMEEGLQAASAIGDDRLQKRSQGYAVPESFTHGSSEQRMRWLKRGLSTSDIQACDTFSANSL